MPPGKDMRDRHDDHAGCRGGGGGRPDRREITLVSTDPEGGPLNLGSFDPVLSDDGHSLVFLSYGDFDLYWKDLRTGGLVLVSADAEGNPGNAPSGLPAVFGISANGRYVAFGSDASNLVPGDDNGFRDVFVKDLRSGEVTLVSATEQGGQGSGPSELAAISDNGRFVAFQSTAANFLPGGAGTGPSPLVFVKDLRTGELALASADADGTPANDFSGDPSISGNGRYVAFQSDATNLVPGDTNGSVDVFVKDLRSGDILRASTDSRGRQAEGESGDPAISGNGRYLAFYSSAALVAEDGNDGFDVYVKDLWSGRVTLVSATPDGQAGSGFSGSPAISDNGRYVAFVSDAPDLVADDGHAGFDVFVTDLRTGRTVLVSRAPDGGPADNESSEPYVTDRGEVVFASAASNLVANDTNGVSDIFLWA